VKPAGKYK